MEAGHTWKGRGLESETSQAHFSFSPRDGKEVEPQIH